MACKAGLLPIILDKTKQKPKKLKNVFRGPPKNKFIHLSPIFATATKRNPLDPLV